MSLCKLSNAMKENIRKKLVEIREHVDTIIKAMNNQECCLLCKITAIKDLAHDVDALASYYHFQSSLFPHVEGMDEISKGIAALSQNRHGALIAIEQDDSMEPFIISCNATGTLIDAKVSGSLLQSIFFPGSPLHDGGVIIRQGKITSAGCVFPLSDKKYTKKGRKIGTRHRAALGMSEKTDAIVIVVSEETGQVSYTLNGVMHPIELDLCENFKLSKV